MNPMTLLRVAGEQDFLIGCASGVLALGFVMAAPRRIGWFAGWSGGAIGGLWWSGWLDDSMTRWPWALILAGMAVLGGAVGMSILRNRVGALAVALLFFLAVLGAWGTVPDTEGARTLLGVTTVALLAFLVPGRARLGTLGGAMALTILACVVVDDGVGRPSSIVGALGSLGMLLVAPGVLRISEARGHDIAGNGLSPGLLLGSQVLLVIVSGRVAGRLGGAPEALVVWIGAACLFGWGWWTLERRRTIPT